MDNWDIRKLEYQNVPKFLFSRHPENHEILELWNSIISEYGNIKIFFGIPEYWNIGISKYPFRYSGMLQFRNSILEQNVISPIFRYCGIPERYIFQISGTDFPDSWISKYSNRKYWNIGISRHWTIQLLSVFRPALTTDLSFCPLTTG